MQEHVAEDKLKPFGFSYGKSGAHTARTMMFEELSSLLNHTSGEAGSTEDFRKAIVEDNCLGKPSGKSRELTFSHLRALYSLDPHMPIFRALLYFWQREEEGRPLLALLCAVARDPLLRKSFEWISAVPIGQQVTRESIEEKLVETYPDRFSPASRKSIAQNLNGTWTKSGHLSGRIHKIRQQARPTPAAAAFALYLGHLQGLRGDVAEAGALAALKQLGVGLAQADGFLTEEERDLRRRLRAHGRQLGDVRSAEGKQELTRLTEEVAYEHWHRMLFARFLAENNLLMYPDPDEPVAVSLEECEEMAPDEGARNGWELASRYAARMLPQIFRPDSPSFELELPLEHQSKLENLLAALSPEVFRASDSLGWVYQFWQAKRKDEVNASEVKIGARELPAVTQLFTEPYMVAFLLDNSLGAWWAARRLSEEDLKTAESEEVLRRKAALPAVPLEYLRFVREEESGLWTPAAGTFEKWPERLAELKTLDPCCGSGHFLVAVMLMLVPMRMELEGLTAREAVDAVLRENLHGLEIDPRCVEIAAFALALTAWRYPEAGGYRALPELQVACSGLSISVAKEEWKQLVNGSRNLRIAMDWLYDTFQNAPVLGSLLDPAKSDAAKVVEWKQLYQTFAGRMENNEKRELGVVAQGLAKAAQLLGEKYAWVVTNVPYLARGKQDEVLRKFCERYYPEGKNDLATAFLDRCLELCTHDSGEGGYAGAVSVVLPQNWLFLTSYRKFREKLLRRDTWRLIARMGPGAFETISGEVVKAILLTMTRGGGVSAKGADEEFDYSGTAGDSAPVSPRIRGLDVSTPRTASEKAAQLLTAEIKTVEQAKQLENPDAIVALDELSTVSPLGNLCALAEGLSRGDMERYDRRFWEMKFVDGKTWQFLLNPPNASKLYSGRYTIFLWEDGHGSLVENPSARVQGFNTWNKKGVFIARSRDLKATLSSGHIHAQSGVAIAALDLRILSALWAFAESSQFTREVRALNSKVLIPTGVLSQVPFDLEHWTKVAEEKYPNGLPKPYSNDPTQWIFHGHPCGNVQWSETAAKLEEGPLRKDETVLHVAVARLLGYRWPAELDAEMELADEQRARVARCEPLLAHADKDGIVCIPPVRGEKSAADRLLNLLAAAFGDAWNHAVLDELLHAAGHSGKTLESWLRDKFFAQHCKLFQHRPFIWHIWDGLRDGFAALVNYHKLDARNLDTLIYTYLGDWISRCQQEDRANGIEGDGLRRHAPWSPTFRCQNIGGRGEPS